MRCILMGVVVLLVGAGEKEPAPARIRLIGEFQGAGNISVNGNTSRFAFLGLADKVLVKAFTTNDAMQLQLDSLTKGAEAARKRTEKLNALVKEFKGKPKELAEAMKKLIEEGKQAQAETKHIVLEGTLTPGKELTARGTLRGLDRAKRDKDIPLGSAVVEGEAVAGNFAAGKDQKTTLAIRNGKSIILVTGKLPEKLPAGTIRVVGRLRLFDKTALIEATRVEAVK